MVSLLIVNLQATDLKLNIKTKLKLKPQSVAFKSSLNFKLNNKTSAIFSFQIESQNQKQN